MRNFVRACVAAAAVSFGSLGFAQDAAEEFAAGITEYLCGLSRRQCGRQRAGCVDVQVPGAGSARDFVQKWWGLSHVCDLSDHRWTNRGEGARKSDARIREPLQGRLAGAYGAEQVVRAKVLAPVPHLQSIQK